MMNGAAPTGYWQYRVSPSLFKAVGKTIQLSVVPWSWLTAAPSRVVRLGPTG